MIHVRVREQDQIRRRNFRKRQRGRNQTFESQGDRSHAQADARKGKGKPAPTVSAGGGGGSAARAEADAKQKYEEKRLLARDIEKKKRRVQELEAAIATGEKDLDALRGRLRQGPEDDWEKLAKMAHEEQALTKKVDSMLLEWAKLSEEVK